MMGFGMGFGGGFGIFGLILMIVLIYVLIRLLQNHPEKDYRPTSNAVDILNERFANGEITEEEYKKMKKTLIG